MSATVADLSEQLAHVKRQLDWFKRQLFGSTSEKRLVFDDVEQASLFAALGVEASPDVEAPTGASAAALKRRVFGEPFERRARFRQ